MKLLDERLCAWGGVFCCAFTGAGLLLAGFVPPPSPAMTAADVGAMYRENADSIRAGMILALAGIAGYAALVGAISAQMRRIRCASRLPCYLQLGAGSIGVLTVMFPFMIMAIAAFRPERDVELTQLLNDVAWLIVIPAFPTFVAQFGAVAAGILQDAEEDAVYPRWAAYLNVWAAVLFLPGAFAYIFRTGPFAWNGVLAFWLALTAFFVWLVAMTFLTLRAINRELRKEALNVGRTAASTLNGNQPQLRGPTNLPSS